MVSLVYSPQSSFCWWILGKSLAWNTTQFPRALLRTSGDGGRTCHQIRLQIDLQSCGAFCAVRKLRKGPNASCKFIMAQELQEFKSSQMVWIPKLLTRNIKKYQEMSSPNWASIGCQKSSAPKMFTWSPSQAHFPPFAFAATKPLPSPIAIRWSVHPQMHHGTSMCYKPYNLIRPKTEKRVRYHKAKLIYSESSEQDWEAKFK